MNIVYLRKNLKNNRIFCIDIENIKRNYISSTNIIKETITHIFIKAMLYSLVIGLLFNVAVLHGGGSQSTCRSDGSCNIKLTARELIEHFRKKINDLDDCLGEKILAPLGEKIIAAFNLRERIAADDRQSIIEPMIAFDDAKKNPSDYTGKIFQRRYIVDDLLGKWQRGEITRFNAIFGVALALNNCPDNLDIMLPVIMRNPTLLKGKLTNFLTLVRSMAARHAQFGTITTLIQRTRATQLCHAIANQKPEEAQTLIDGADVNYSDTTEGKTAVMLCAEHATLPRQEKLALLQSLKDAGADLNRKDAEGRTSTMNICRKPYEYYQWCILQWLCDHNANINAQDPAGLTAYNYATLCDESGHYAKLLEHYKANTTSPIHMPQPGGTLVGYKTVAGTIPPAVQRFIECIKNPKKYARLGAKSPRGILLVGAPGMGKTHLARAISQEAGTTFFAIKASDLYTKWYGESAKQVDDLFAQAAAKTPAIVFIDELDAIASRSSLLGCQAEDTKVLTALLGQMDGFQRRDGVYVIGATNKPKNLDPALRREGRFDQTIEIPSPTYDDRKAVLQFYALSKRYHTTNVNFNTIAQLTDGWSNAALAELVEEATRLAVYDGADYVSNKHFMAAIDARNKHQSEIDS